MKENTAVTEISVTMIKTFNGGKNTMHSQRWDTSQYKLYTS